MVFEIWEDPTGQARFSFSQVSKDFSTGVLTLQSGVELPKHHRPHAYENLLQIAGRSQVTLLDEAGAVMAVYDLTPGSCLRMEKGQWHIHSNPFDELSVTQFRADGDITAIVDDMRRTYTKIEPNKAQSQV